MEKKILQIIKDTLKEHIKGEVRVHTSGNYLIIDINNPKLISFHTVYTNIFKTVLNYYDAKTIALKIVKEYEEYIISEYFYKIW